MRKCFLTVLREFNNLHRQVVKILENQLKNRFGIVGHCLIPYRPKKVTVSVQGTADAGDLLSLQCQWVDVHWVVLSGMKLWKKVTEGRRAKGDDSSLTGVTGGISGCYSQVLVSFHLMTGSILLF